MVTKTTASRRKPTHDPRDNLIKSLLEALQPLTRRTITTGYLDNDVTVIKGEEPAKHEFMAARYAADRAERMGYTV